jgi:hypothetical protein
MTLTGNRLKTSGNGFGPVYAAAGVGAMYTTVQWHADWHRQFGFRVRLTSYLMFGVIFTGQFMFVSNFIINM